MSRIYEVRLVGEGKEMTAQVFGKRGRYRKAKGPLKKVGDRPEDVRTHVLSVVGLGILDAKE